MSNIWYTSDLHLGHDGVAELRGMGTKQHDQWIADNWAGFVRPQDHVWVLGDLCLSGLDDALALIDSLPGVKHLVAGNHDACHPLHRDGFKQHRRYLEVFASVQTAARHRVAVLPIAEGAHRRQDVLLSHFPYEGDHTDDDRHTQWRLPDEGLSLLHGHTHSTSRGDSRLVHVGVDAWGRPVSRDEIAVRLGGRGLDDQ